MKGVRSLELGRSGLLFAPADADRAAKRPERGRHGAAEAAGGSDRPPDVGSVPRARPRLERRADPRAHEDRSLVPAAVRRDRGDAARAAAERARRRSTPDAMRRLKRAGFGDAGARAGGRRRARRRSASGATAQGLKPVYKRVDTCAAEFESFTPYLYSSYEPTCESNPNGREQGRHPRQRAEPDRPGHRVRLLLLSRRLRAARRRPRDGDDQLQSGDGVDRLRHRRPAVLPAADVRRRDGGDRDRALGRRRGVVPRAVRRPDAAQAGAGAAGGRRPDSRHVARLDRPRRGSQALRGAAVGAGHHAAGERHGDVARGSARGRRRDRLSGRRAAVVRARRPRRWRSSTTSARSIAT